jgi:hypothetical protein
LKISQPNDKYEQEADRVADEVMRMPEPKVQRQVKPGDEKESIQRKTIASKITPLVQRQTSDEDDDEEAKGQVQPKTNNPIAASNSSVPINFLKNLGSGKTLDAGTRSFFEPRLGHDFSQVRIHTDYNAAILADSIHARAYTLGSDVVFGRGQYAPGTAHGQRLLAHELTHTLQNTGMVQRVPDLSKTRPPDLPYPPYHSEMEAGYRACIELKKTLPSKPTEDAKEWGTTVFRVTRAEGDLYSFMPLTEGTGKEWHPTGRIPDYAEETAVAHTHPMGTYFSKQDADLALGKSGFFLKKRTVFMVNQNGIYWFIGRNPGGVELERSKRKGKF